MISINKSLEAASALLRQLFSLRIINSRKITTKYKNIKQLNRNTNKWWNRWIERFRIYHNWNTGNICFIAWFWRCFGCGFGWNSLESWWNRRRIHFESIVKFECILYNMYLSSSKIEFAIYHCMLLINLYHRYMSD